MMSVLVTPLDWGLGHASRCVPIIRALIERKCRVVIAGSGNSLAMLALEFPKLTMHEIPGYRPSYPASGSMVTKMVVQIPKFFRAIAAEHCAIARIVKHEGIHLVISDNRYGCWSENVTSILITHQSNVLMPSRFGWLQSLVRYVTARYMKKFSRCWIPDTPDASLSGALIAFGKFQPGIKADFIGHLSRFEPSEKKDHLYDVVAVLSGPEPQRTLLEKKLVPQLEASGLRYFVVRGLPAGQSPANGVSADFLTSRPLQELIESSAVVIARCGYSTVMDLAVLGKKAIFIPTPGQTEQEYLAERLRTAGIAYAVEQDNFSLREAMAQGNAFKGFTRRPPGENRLLSSVIDLALNTTN